MTALWLQTAPADGAPTNQVQNTTADALRLHDNLRLADFRAHDPFILPYQANQTYYLFTAIGPRTGLGRGGVVAYKSKDLLKWDGPHLVFTVPDGVWADPKDGLWAPEVHEYKGKFYLLCTLHNTSAVFAIPPETARTNHLRGTVIAISDSPDGPFKMLKTSGPYPPTNFMTLDGTFYVDPAGTPWMVYAHEWVQVTDGTMEAIRLKPDLSDSVGSPIHLFKGSDAPWINAQKKPSTHENRYVTDGPELYRTTNGRLLMLWSSYDTNGYVQTLARSLSDSIQGPWEQLPRLVGNDSGHGMLFRTFDGQLMLVLHHPFRNPLARARLYEMEDTGDTVRVVRPRHDLDGSPDGP